MQHHLSAVRRICLFVFCLTFALTLVLGLVRFRGDLRATGQAFIDLNKADALVHVTLAQRILNGQGYTNPPGVNLDGSVRGSDPAFEKAPGYPYLLAGLFRITGIGFSFFPLQCVIAGFLSVLVVLVSVEVFGDPVAALIAGLGASVHPVLVNTASQLYNENLYFCLFFLCIWLYLRWHRAPSNGLALVCGCCAGLTALVRESIVLPFAALVLWVVVWGWRTKRAAALRGAVVMMAGFILIVMPWTIRNYVVSGEVVPISTISLFLIGAGNDSCVAAGGWTTPFFGDDPCRSLDAERAEFLASHHQTSNVLTESRASAAMGERFILNHPGEYLKLCVRRAWTVFDPWHTQQHLTGGKKLVMLLYFLIFVASGLAGVAWLASREPSFQVKSLYIVLLASYFPLVAIFVSHDHRFAVGIHLILACFAGAWFSRFAVFLGLRRRLESRTENAAGAELRGQTRVGLGVTLRFSE